MPLNRDMKIDAHHHFWHYSREAFGWIDPTQSVLQRDFLPHDLKSEINRAGIDRVITVQARQCLEETHWLLELAAQNNFIAGVVGWVPLISPDIQTHLQTLVANRVANRKLRGVRHVLHDEADDLYMLRPDFNAGIALLKKFDLIYDILIFERHLPQTIQFVDTHPDQIFVVDHLAKPRIKAGAIEPWRSAMKNLSRRPGVYCKLSGAVTEADHHSWTASEIRPYFDTILEYFGPKRILFGSDWPVCLLACSYGRWVQTVKSFLQPLSANEQAAIMGNTAAKVYGLASDS